MSIGFVSFVCAVITTLVAWGAFKVGVYVGRDQEYVRRTRRVLMAMKSIRDWTSDHNADKRASRTSINVLADKTIEQFAAEADNASL